MTRAVACVMAAFLLASCASDEPTAEDGGVSTAEPSGEASDDGSGRSEVASLDLSLRLPDSFTVFDDPELVFLARSTQPPAVLSIAEEPSDIVEHVTEDSETVSNLSIDGVEAVVVANAVLEGIPPGIVADELLVSNGDRSFSLLSTTELDLAAMWAEVLSSISIG